SPTASPTPTPKPTPTPEPPSAKIKVGKKVKKIYETEGEFTKSNKKLYFKKDNGKKYKKGFFLNKKGIYFARKDGEIQKTWLKYKGNIYFFSRKNGKLAKSKTAEGVKLGKYGTVKSGAINKERAETYVKAADVVRKITKAKDKKSKKLKKCYNWVMQFNYVRHRKMKEMMTRANWKKTWDLVFANDIFEKKSGCCVSYSAAFALMAKECGYKKVTLCCDTGHAWDDIGGRLYDPLFAKSRDFHKNYNAKYTDYRRNPAITKKIS
ncbi:MAG: hypothetical protein K5639_03975, partial [Eubacterium sp.]|nr:hypothetical protein [Eubacterium sp.]